MSTTYIIDKMSASKEITIDCIDTWEGSGEEHEEYKMNTIEKNFDDNTNYSLKNAIISAF